MKRTWLLMLGFFAGLGFINSIVAKEELEHSNDVLVRSGFVSSSNSVSLAELGFKDSRWEFVQYDSHSLESKTSVLSSLTSQVWLAKSTGGDQRHLDSTYLQSEKYGFSRIDTGWGESPFIPFSYYRHRDDVMDIVFTITTNSNDHILMLIILEPPHSQLVLDKDSNKFSQKYRQVFSYLTEQIEKDNI